MSLRAIVRTLAGRVFGFDKDGNIVWNRRDAKQLSIDLNGSNVPFIETTIAGVTTQYPVTGSGAAQQYQNQGVNLGGPDATTINFGSENLQATRVGATITVVDPSVIMGVVDGGVTDNAATLQSYIGPAENSGTIVAADGVNSEIPNSTTGFLVKSTINVDPQVSIYWDARGGTVIVPDARIPALTPGTAGTGVRVGGGAPSSVFRSIRRAPGLNKQAYEPTIGGFCIDGTGIKNSASFTTDGSATITSANHLRQNGDLVYFDKDPDGTGLPNGTPSGTGLFVVDESNATAYTVTNATTNTFQVTSPAGAAVNPGVPVTAITAGKGVWSTNVHGIRIPNCQPSSNSNDPDEAFDTRKTYTAGSIRDVDLTGLSGSGLVSEGGSGRLHLHSVRAISNRVHGFDIASNDTILSGHWAAGSNGGFGVHKGSGTGLYAWGGNMWGLPGARSLNCGAMYLRDTAYWIIGGSEFNDWGRFDGIKNFNAAGGLIGNMCHPHAENFSSDGIGIDRQSSGDYRMQSHFGIRGYQGLNLFGNVYSRTENIGFTTPYNFPDAGYNSGTSDTTGKMGSAVQYLSDIGGTAPSGTTIAAVQIFDGYCTAPDAKPYYGSISSVSFSIASPCAMTWAGHPFVVGSRFRVHTTGTLPTGITGDTQDYFVTTVVDANTVNFSATYSGSNVNTTGSAGSGHTGVHVGSIPYHISGQAMVGGYAFDSYRGAHYIWSANGVAPKIVIGAAQTGTQQQPWEGNPSYFMELGSKNKTAGVQARNGQYGLWEFDNNVLFADNAVNLHTFNSGTFTRSVSAGAAEERITLSGGTFTAGTITLPSGADMNASQHLAISVRGQQVTALTWAFSQAGGAFTNNGIPAPTWVPPGGLAINLFYERDKDGWTVLQYRSDGGLVGRIDNASQSAGIVGEQLQAKVTSSSMVSCGASNTITNVTSVALTPGDWNVVGEVVFTTNSATSTQMTKTQGVLTTTSSGNFSTNDASSYTLQTVLSTSVATSGTDLTTVQIGPTRITVSSTATTQSVWLNVRPNMAAANISAWGNIRAIRTA